MQLNSTVLKNITVLYVPYGEPLRAAAPLHNGFHCGIHAPAGYIDAQVIVCRRPPGLVALEAIVGRPGPVHSLQLFLCFGSGHAVPAADPLDAVTMVRREKHPQKSLFIPQNMVGAAANDDAAALASHRQKSVPLGIGSQLLHRCFGAVRKQSPLTHDQGIEETAGGLFIIGIHELAAEATFFRC